MSFDESTAVYASATAQDTADVNDDCCEVCLVAERDARIALVPCDISVSVSRALTKCWTMDVTFCLCSVTFIFYIDYASLVFRRCM